MIPPAASALRIAGPAPVLGAAIGARRGPVWTALGLPPEALAVAQGRIVPRVIGGALRGFGARGTGRTRDVAQVRSIRPALFVLATLWSARPALMLAAGFALADRWAVRAALAPAWRRRVRFGLRAVIVPSLVAVA